MNMQLSFNRSDAGARGVSVHPVRADRKLSDLSQGEGAVIDRLDLPRDQANRLMELGFVPGNSVTMAHTAPGGDPCVFRVDGSEVALRRETAFHLFIK